MMHPAPLAVRAASLYFLRLNCSIFHQLQLEEALLRADERNWCIINEGASPSIVMGISGKQELLVNSAKMSQHRVPLIRRFSGGGTVFVDENTYFVTWICNAACAGSECYPKPVHEWAASFYQKAFPSLDFQLRENDYVINDRKCGGNAQYFRKERWLHHSSLLWDYDSKNMEYLHMPPKMPQYRQQREHDQFLCRLKDFLPGREFFEASMLNTIHSLFDVKIMQLSDVETLLDGDHRKATELLFL